MMYKFRSRADSDLFMNQGPAERILSIIGKQAGPQGIIEPADMPRAIAALQAAVEQDERGRGASQDAGASDGGAGASGGGAQAVTLRQRAWPFVQLLKRSLEADTPVVWGV
jgi:cyclopropane-fatty-acyl-phospholipid synthase